MTDQLHRRIRAVLNQGKVGGKLYSSWYTREPHEFVLEDQPKCMINWVLERNANGEASKLVNKSYIAELLHNAGLKVHFEPAYRDHFHMFIWK
jgi:hypothetical protein